MIQTPQHFTKSVMLFVLWVVCFLPPNCPIHSDVDAIIDEPVSTLESHGETSATTACVWCEWVGSSHLLPEVTLRNQSRIEKILQASLLEFATLVLPLHAWVLSGSSLVCEVPKSWGPVLKFITKNPLLLSVSVLLI